MELFIWRLFVCSAIVTLLWPREWQFWKRQ